MGYRTPISRIAVVDEDASVRASLSGLLRALGYDARTFASADEFLRALPRFAPRCLISAAQMPGMQGEQLQTEILSSGHRFPVIFHTDSPTDAMRQRLLAAGAFALLATPVEADAIAACLAAALATVPG